MANLMELSEVQKLRSLYDGCVWLEVKDMGVMPALMEMAMHNITFFVAIPLLGYREAFYNEEYNHEWRCWRTRPTTEEIKETPWEIFAEQIKMGGN